MFLYVFILSLFVKPRSLVTNESKVFNDISLQAGTLFFLFPVVMIGLRSSVNDTPAYINMFNNLHSSFSEIIAKGSWDHGISWDIYQWFIKYCIKNDVYVFFMITAIIQSGAIVKLYRKYSNDYGYSVLLFFLSMSFLNMMGGIRQQMAACVIFYGIDWLFESKNIRFVVLVLFASTIHFSAIIWIPILFVVQGKSFDKKTVMLSALLIIIIIYLNRFTDMLSDALEMTAYDGYTQQFAVDDGANIIHALIAAVPIGIALIGKKNIDLKNDRRIHMLVNIAFVNLLINILASFTSGILIGRLPMYIDVFSYALIPILLYSIFESKSERLMKILAVIFYFAYALYYMLSIGLNYSSFILHIG